jgi:hypothetical protein
VIEPDDLGPETPAVVDLLVHGGEPSGNAVAATVLDLAARGHVELEETSPGRYLCRLPQQDDERELTSYEAQVMALLHDRARARVVPAEALTVGVDDEASDWWVLFRRNVHAHASELGLTRPRWGLVGALVLGVMGALAVAFWWWNDSWVALLVFGLGFAIGFLVCIRSDDWGSLDALSTDGQERRVQWSAVRDELGASDSFVDLPPTSVSIWGRYLGYAAALGLAPDACRALPLGPDSSRFAWVRRDGVWRRLPARVPRRFLPGSGRPTRAALGIGTVATTASAVTLVAAARPGRWHPSPPFSDDVADFIGDVEPLVVVLALVVLVLGLWELAVAVFALFTAPRVVDGTIVSRCVRQGWRANPWSGMLPAAYYVVVDDGTSESLPGWRVSPAEFAGLARGEAVTVWVDTRIGRVRSIERPSDDVSATPGRRGRRGRARGGRDGGPSS